MGAIQNSINQAIGSLAIFGRLNPKSEAKIQAEYDKQIEKYSKYLQRNPEARQRFLNNEPEIDISKPYEGEPVSEDWTADIQSTGLGNARADAQMEIKQRQMARIKGWKDARKAQRQINQIEKIEKREAQKGVL